MFEWFRMWRIQRRLAKRKTEFLRGYLSARAEFDELGKVPAHSMPWDDETPFDEGWDAAVRDIERGVL